MSSIVGQHLQARHILNGSHHINTKAEKKIKYKALNMNPKNIIKTDKV